MISEQVVSSTSVQPAVRVSRLDRLTAIAIVLMLALLIGFSIYAQSPPPAQSASIPAATFSAGRASRYVSAIGTKPHPSGSVAHGEVRDYLMRELETIGLQPRIQHSMLFNADQGAAGSGTQNVLARLKGTGNGKAVLLVAHYDSTKESFGASDNGSSVAALLETLHTLKAGAPLKNDVIVLFTDAEEQGMLGAQVFVAENDWARDVGLVLNFEARGSDGPVMMFETSDNNGWLMKEFAKAAPFPFAHSLSYEIYRLLPNETDLTVFKDAGLRGLNFANIDGFVHYHSPDDSLSAVDSSTLQHRGSYAVALTQHFGNVDLDQQSNENAVYFDLFGSVLVHYSSFWVIPLTVLACVLFVALLLLGFRKQRLTTRGIGWGLVSLLASVVTAALAVFALWKAVWTFRDAPSPQFLQSRLFLFGFIVLAVAIMAVVYKKLGHRASAESLAVGAIAFWLLLTVAITFYIPGASFLFHWPLLASMIGLGWMMVQPESRKISSMLMLGLCAAPALILWVPVIYQIFIGLTLNWISFTIAQVVLIFGLLLPLSLLVKSTFKRESLRS